MSDIWQSPCGRMELRLGRWQDVLWNVTECDAVITDPPYSKRVALGYRSQKDYRAGAGPVTGPNIGYGHLDAEGFYDFVEGITKIHSWWFVIFNDHIGARHLDDALSKSGLYVFGPVCWVKRDACPRFNGDGPTVSVEWITVARPRRRLPKQKVRSRPGHYITAGVSAVNQSRIVTGQKPIGLMQSVIADYTEPGDLVVEPFAGSGTTLLAAATIGRRAIGAECDPETYAKAVKRLSAGYTPAIVFDRKPKPKQEGMF